MIKNERIKTYPASQEQMEKYIASETDEELKKAYGEMLEGCLAHHEEWDWYMALGLICKKMRIIMERECSNSG